MLEKPLLLSEAKLGVLGSTSSLSFSRLAILGIGLLVVAVGGADVSARLVYLAGGNALFTTFAPAIAITDPAPFSTLPVPIIPERIRIAALGVDTEVEAVGVKADGSMNTPSNFKNVAWYKLGSQPGAPGNAVIAGHVNNALGLSGVFENLTDVALGDTIEVSDTAGRTFTFIVKEKNVYALDLAPTEDIFATSGVPQLVLITCEGEWDAVARSYDKRLVVVAKLLTP